MTFASNVDSMGDDNASDGRKSKISDPLQDRATNRVQAHADNWSFTLHKKHWGWPAFLPGPSTIRLRLSFRPGIKRGGQKPTQQVQSCGI